MNESDTSTPPVLHTLTEWLPTRALAQHVTCVWVQEVSPDSATFLHRKAPNGSAELICTLGSAPRILGPQTGPVIESLAPGTTVVGVRLRPGAAPPVLHLSASETADLDLGADELWGDAALALGEAVAAADSPESAAGVLERAVADRLAEGPELDSVGDVGCASSIRPTATSSGSSTGKRANGFPTSS